MRLSPSAHADTFCRDNLPPDGLWPDFLFTLPELQYPERLNAAAELLDVTAEKLGGGRPCLLAEDRSHLELRRRGADLQPGGAGAGGRAGRGAGKPGAAARPEQPVAGRVLARACSRPAAVAVTTMSLLRSGELATICEVSRPTVALCDHRFTEDLVAAGVAGLQIVSYGGAGPEDLTARVAAEAAQRSPPWTPPPTTWR